MMITVDNTTFIEVEKLLLLLDLTKNSDGYEVLSTFPLNIDFVDSKVTEWKDKIIVDSYGSDKTAVPDNKGSV